MVCWTIFDADIEAKTAIYPAALESIIMAIFNDFELDNETHSRNLDSAGRRTAMVWCPPKTRPSLKPVKNRNPSRPQERLPMVGNAGSWHGAVVATSQQLGERLKNRDDAAMYAVFRRPALAAAKGKGEWWRAGDRVPTVLLDLSGGSKYLSNI
jgi:hypothetical protein